jgi:hypothetical protein
VTTGIFPLSHPIEDDSNKVIEKPVQNEGAYVQQNEFCHRLRISRTKIQMSQKPAVKKTMNMSKMNFQKPYGLGQFCGIPLLTTIMSMGLLD